MITRSPSTISRELRRNRGACGCYSARAARQQMQARLKKTFAANAQSLMTENASRGITTTVSMGLTTASKNMLMLYGHLSAGRAKPLNNLLQLFGMLPGCLT